MSELERVEWKTFGPRDTVVLDGKSFFHCVFEGCELVYYASDMPHIHEGCTFSGCRVTFANSAWWTVQLMMRLGYKITSPSGQNPEAKSVQ
jgi:hypothetical protein